MKKDYLTLIQEFIGKGGFVSFEHNFTIPTYELVEIWGVDNKFIYCGISKILLNRIDEKQLKEIYESLQNYLIYCQKFA